MKRLALALIGIMIIGALAYAVTQKTEVVEYVKPTVIKEQVEVTPDWAEDEDAVQAAQDVLRKKELEAELESLTVEREAIQERINEVEKQLGTY